MWQLNDSDDSSAKKVLQWTPQGHKERGRPRNTWKKRVLERKIWTAGFRFSWIQMEMAAQDRARDEWSVAFDTLRVTRHKSSQ